MEFLYLVHWHLIYLILNRMTLASYLMTYCHWFYVLGGTRPMFVTAWRHDSIQEMNHLWKLILVQLIRLSLFLYEMFMRLLDPFPNMFLCRSSKIWVIRSVFPFADSPLLDFLSHESLYWSEKMLVESVSSDVKPVDVRFSISIL